MKNHHLDLVRVTEAGAISAAEWVGRGDKLAADKAAVDAMRERLNEMDFSATIAIGEGKKDESYGLYEGENVGSLWDEEDDEIYELAVDPIDGTTPTVKGGYEAMSVIAMGHDHCFFKTERFYMMKLAVGPAVRRAASGFRPDLCRDNLTDCVYKVAGALSKPVQHLTVCLLDRPRHENFVKELRSLGCRIKLISDCDVTACIAACVEGSGVDMYYGIGGAPEAMIAAAAVKCMGGDFQAILANDDGVGLFNLGVLRIEDLAKGDVVFAATGITDGQLLKGVQFTERGTVTHSITMRSESGTVRRIITEHGN